MKPPLAIDLFCGSFGWSAGWLELGGRVVGFDIEHEPYHGPVPRGADLVLQDVRTMDRANLFSEGLKPKTRGNGPPRRFPQGRTSKDTRNG